jgi:hypothetical protein
MYFLRGVAASIRAPLPSLQCPLGADRAVRLRPEALGLLLPPPVSAGLARLPRHPLTVDRDTVLLAVFSAAFDFNNKLSETDENAIRQWRADSWRELAMCLT